MGIGQTHHKCYLHVNSDEIPSFFQHNSKLIDQCLDYRNPMGFQLDSIIGLEVFLNSDGCCVIGVTIYGNTRKHISVIYGLKSFLRQIQQ